MDDIILIGSNDLEIQQLIALLNDMFALKYLGLHYFMGIEFNTFPNGDILLIQSKYIHELIVKAKMEASKLIATPMLSQSQQSTHICDFINNPSFYRSIVGTLQYIIITHSNLSYTFNKLCQYMSKPF